MKPSVYVKATMYLIALTICALLVSNANANLPSEGGCVWTLVDVCTVVPTGCGHQWTWRCV